MRLIRRYLHYLILLICFIGLVSLWGFSLVADQPVTIKDPNLEAVIRETLEQPEKPLHASTLSKITRLDAARREITSLEGIEALTNLTVLDLQNNSVQDVSALSRLKKLRTLNLRENGLIDLEKANLASLRNTSLRELDLSYNVIFLENGQKIWLSDLTALSNIKTLTNLIVTENKVEDISALSFLGNLKTLNLQYNLVRDISALRGMKALRNLTLGKNNVIDLSPLEGLTQLRTLDLSDNQNITSLLPLTDLTQLRILNLNHVAVGDEILVLRNKYNLQELYIAGGQVKEITALKDLQSLTKLGLRDNKIVDLTPLSGMIRLVELDLQANPLVNSLSPIGNLKNLEELDIQDVPVGEDVWVLANLSRLRQLDARNCGIADTSALGVLMSQGALQENEKLGFFTTVDLRDNPLEVTETDDYGPIRDYWTNISTRLPFVLPEFVVLPAPVFSASGGFSDEPLQLTITTEVSDSDIYYTLDGSEPTLESALYSGPIQINSRMGEPDRLAKIRATSTRWKQPLDKVAKATVVRARVYRKDQAASAVVTNTYFVGMGRKYTLPIVSIATNPDYFFDYRYGIYVMGEIYDQYSEIYAHLNPWERPANYKQTGDAWERPVHIEYYDVLGVQQFSQNVTARIHGAATRELPQKSLRIYADCESDCEGAVNFPLFPDLTAQATDQPITAYRTFLLRSSGNDWGSTMFRDAFVQSLVDQTRLDTQAYQPTIVFLNGEYWGIHNLRERLDEYYIQSHYGIDPQDVVILSENAVLEVGVEGDQEHYLRMIDFVKTHDMQDADNYAQVQTWMDIDNFIDYQIIEIYSNNNNWPHVNIKYWRKNTSAYEPNAPYGQDGRWRWMLYDTDFAFGLNEGMEGSTGNNLVAAIEPVWNDWSGKLLQSLLKNPEFRSRFLNRFADMMNTAFEPQRVLERMDQMKTVIEPEIEEHTARWKGTKDGLKAWNERLDVMRFFAKDRPKQMYQQLVDYFQLDGTIKVHLETDEQAGYIRINSMDISDGTAGVTNTQSWTGTYFQGIPIQITAIARPGYRFDRWETDNPALGSASEIQITPEGDISLRAIFVRE